MVRHATLVNELDKSYMTTVSPASKLKLKTEIGTVAVLLSTDYFTRRSTKAYSKPCFRKT